MTAILNPHTGKYTLTDDYDAEKAAKEKKANEAIVTEGSYSIYTTRGKARHDKRRFEPYLDKQLTLDHHLYFQWLNATSWLKEGRIKHHQMVLIYPKFADQLEQYFVQLLKDYPERVRADVTDPRKLGTLAVHFKPKPATHKPVSLQDILKEHPTKGKQLCQLNRK